MKYVLSFLILVCVTVSKRSFSQQKGKALVFHSIEQLGTLTGDRTFSAAVQSINGFEYRTWFAGVGAGIDFYRYRSVPLFIDIRKNFPLRRNSVFVYVDGGYNMPWIKEKEEEVSIWLWSASVKEDYKGGGYTDAGLGYSFLFNRGKALVLSVGYSHKYFSEKRTTTSWIGGIADERIKSVDTQRFSYSFNRIMMKAGWQF